ncbi:hypothetical protein M378DRAFT_166825 [Amanita muscaria Koide BX008]|uniref:Major facilitator superfamily (MFS) profile domain-containing protein n=1 Tax=Amanita muscaria (strain Koide BX008) TaxID=946122 RepID=A0A0C2WYS9_AMAMK|nr:hypothetical protein M378DRAFT_166825 [Amanita muscaria Koide BX008]
MTITTSFDSESQHEANQHANTTSEDYKEHRTPLPWVQLVIVYLIQFAEPVTGIVIYPFINEFVRNTGITGGDDKRTGYFAGIIESAFFFAEAATVILWGMASDRFGRRPILVIGPLGLAIAMIGFGMSTTFWPLVVFRCFQGVFNGNIGVSKSVVGELTDKTNIGDAVAFLPFVWSVGVTIAPIIGGVLSRPADQWPDTLGRIPYLKSHPYFLPCFVASLIAFITFLIALSGLKETLRSAILKQKKRKTLNERSPTPSTRLTADADVPDYGSLQVDDSPTIAEDSINMNDEQAPSLRAILTPEVLIVLVNYVFLTFCDMSVVVLAPLVWSTPVKDGGLGFTAFTIGVTMGTFGLVNALIQINLLGKILRRFGTRRVYIVCFSNMFVSLWCFILETKFARQAGRADWRVWSMIVVQLTMDSFKYGAYGSMHVMVTQSAPSRSALGTVNGIAQALGCVQRSLAPSVASSLYALSLQRGWLGGNAVYYILMVVVACGFRFAFTLPTELPLQ